MCRKIIKTSGALVGEGFETDGPRSPDASSLITEPDADSSSASRRKASGCYHCGHSALLGQRTHDDDRVEHGFAP